MSRAASHHSRDELQGGNYPVSQSANSRGLSQHPLLRLFQKRDHLRAFHRRKSLEEIVNGLAALDVKEDIHEKISGFTYGVIVVLLSAFRSRSRGQERGAAF